MSKCRSDCCSGSNGEGSAGAIIGFIVLAAAVYGIIRAIAHAVEAIMHTVIEIVEITAITVGSTTVAAMLILIAVRVIRRHHKQTRQAEAKVLAISLASSPTAVHRSAIPAVDTARLFAEAVASPDMDPRFIDAILRNAMEGPRQ